MITGGIKFFKRSKSLFLDGASAIASSNNDVANNILSSNKFIKWESFGSNDMTTETIEITFDSATINRIFLISTNFKEFNVKYDVAGTPTDFTNVLGLDGELNEIEETNYNKDTAYYEFDSVTTDKIYITVMTTQIADQEKSLERFYATEEIGTLTGYPIISKEELDQNINKQETLSGNMSIQKRIETFNATLSFKNYTPNQNDYDIMNDITISIEPFLVWLCGGKFGDNFRVARRNWLLKDVYNVQAISKLSFKWNKNIYLAGFSGNVKLTQSTEAL
jgi:hypothetical protein